MDSVSPLEPRHSQASDAHLLWEACLPAEFRGPTTTFTRIAAGLSGAAVYRVEAANQRFVLKISSQDELAAAWEQRVRFHQMAADANLAPAVVHVDPRRRAVLSVFIVDRSFPAFFRNPATHADALSQLGKLLRRVHDLPLPADAEVKNSQHSLEAAWTENHRRDCVPTFVADAVQRGLAETPPASDRAAVLSHNDVNPSNIVYDGERLLLIDWDVAGANDPFYDSAAISVFLCLDPAASLGLLAAYDGRALTGLPPRFVFMQRQVALLCGATFLKVALKSGYAGAIGDETLETTSGLREIFRRMHSGTLSPATADGQWQIGLALVKAASAI